MFALGGGLYLGWAMGANDASNIFGTAVASRVLRFRTATILCAVAVIVGAVLQGEAGIATLRNLSGQNASTLLLVSVSAAITVTLMTFLRLPCSSSQAIIGAIAAVGLVTNTMQWGSLLKVVLCWIATPIGAMGIAAVVYYLAGWFLQTVPMSILSRDRILWWGLVVVGVYGSYALGANSVANATGIYSGRLAGVSDRMLAILGGCSIAAGALTYSRRVMTSVGRGIMHMDAFTAFVAVTAMSIMVHGFAMIGVPVSIGQAIVGAVFGVGMLRGVHTLRFRMLRNIVFGWFITPTVSLLLAAAGYALFRLGETAVNGH